jgi:A118 family predicted phage portal protein
MFLRILEWIREVFQKMIGQGSVQTALGVDIAISPWMARALQLWSLMYINRAPWLVEENYYGAHDNDIYGLEDIHNLNLPTAIASEISRSVTIEMKVEMSGSPRANYLNTQIERIVPKLPQMVEYAVAKGGMIFKPYVNGDKIDIDYVQADQFYPIAFDANGNITAAVFADQRQIGRKFYTRLEYHTMTATGCEIKNLAYVSFTKDVLGSQTSLADVDAWKDLLPEATITGIEKPLFAYFRYPLANNIDPTSPLGVSCYSRAVELIHDADKQWSDFLWEFESGQRALYVDVEAFGKDKNGNPKLPNKRLFRTLDSVSNDVDLFKEWTPTLREVNILNGLDAILKKIEFVCGLASGTLSNDPTRMERTATEIKISKQRTYATITNCQKALRDALEQLMWAMDQWTTITNLAPRGTYQVVFDFDDSIVADHDVQFAQDTQALGLGVISKAEFRMNNYGETEEIAKQKIADIQAEQQAEQSFFGQTVPPQPTEKPVQPVKLN